MSHLLQMRGLKLVSATVLAYAAPSHLLQMRGLKLVTMYAKVNNIDTSHLLQMRGLKPIQTAGIDGKAAVASFTDAWIETITPRLPRG